MEAEYGAFEYGDLVQYGGDLNAPAALGVLVTSSGGRTIASSPRTLKSATLTGSGQIASGPMALVPTIKTHGRS